MATPRGHLDLVGTPSLVALDGNSLIIGTEGDNDVLIVREGEVVFGFYGSNYAYIAGSLEITDTLLLQNNTPYRARGTNNGPVDILYIDSAGLTIIGGQNYSQGGDGWAFTTNDQTNYWSMLADITQNTTNGGNIVLAKASTCVAQTTVGAISAAGTDLATATALTGVFNDVTTTASSTGVALWDAPIGACIIVKNSGANQLAVYPAGASQTIDAGTGGSASAIETTKSKIFVRITSGASGKWVTLAGA